MNRWNANVAFSTNSTFTHDTAFDVLDRLTDYAASVAPRADGSGGAISFSIEAENVTAAFSSAIAITTDTVAQLADHPTINAVEIMTEEELDNRLAEPTFPEVVGYAEIAELASVSRQRARQFSKINGFPAPVITTAQGPLMAKSAVEAWLESRNTRSGRPKKAAIA